MRIKAELTALILCLASASSPSRTLGAESGERFVKGSAEQLFWQSPATMHDFKSSSDLHNRLAALLVITELEFVRLGDMGISFILRQPVRPLEQGIDAIEAGYLKIPPLRPVRRAGELIDAIQIPEFSLSDARGLFLFAGGSSSGAVGPIMQVVEDVIGDVDYLIMLPANYTVEKLRGSESDLRTVGYAGNSVGLLRNGLFWGIRAVNRVIIRTSSHIVRKTEGGGDAFVRRKKTSGSRHYPIYAQFPGSVFAAHTARFREKDFFLAGTKNDWQEKTRGGITAAEILKDENAGNIQLNENRSGEPILMAAEAGFWNELPAELQPYVITAEEFREFLEASGN